MHFCRTCSWSFNYPRPVLWAEPRLLRRISRLSNLFKESSCQWVPSCYLYVSVCLLIVVHLLGMISSTKSPWAFRKQSITWYRIRQNLNTKLHHTASDSPSKPISHNSVLMVGTPKHPFVGCSIWVSTVERICDWTTKIELFTDWYQLFRKMLALWSVCEQLVPLSWAWHLLYDDNTIGKANLSEFTHSETLPLDAQEEMASARTLGYFVNADPHGSSAVAASIGLATVTLATETDGSITSGCPTDHNNPARHQTHSWLDFTRCDKSKRTY